MNLQQLKNECMKYYQKVSFFDISYKWTSQLVFDYWDNSRIVTAGVSILLLDWNRAYYRVRGSLCLRKLERCIQNWHKDLSAYRQQKIYNLESGDNNQIEQVFNEFEKASRGGKSPDRAPVSAAKALHLLAPRFFPPWDDSIAQSHGCRKMSPEDYAKFSVIIYKMANEVLEDHIKVYGGTKEEAEKVISRNVYPNQDFEKSLVKLIDEYNYSKVHLT